MAEIMPKVYDIVFPSPATLQEISSIAVVLQIWQSGLKKYGWKDVVEKLYPEDESIENIPFPDVISNLPSEIDCMIKKYHETFMCSVIQWLEFNFTYIFEAHRNDSNDILKDFSDIACDFNGTVHFDRTAKRMLQCDRISQDEKFTIACAYCFEDDIRRIWPSVENKMDLNEMEFYKYPHLYYWVCRIRNAMNKIPDQIDDESVEERMIEYETESRSTFEYFWNRISLEKQSEIAFEFCQTGIIVGCYSRWIVPKLNEEQIAQFLDNEKIIDWFHRLIENEEGSREYVLPVWMCIKNTIKESTFTKLAEKLISIENNLCFADASTEQASQSDEIFTLCCDIWNSAPDYLKRASIKYLCNSHQLLESWNWKLSLHREIRFLMVVLSDASLKERSIFWHNSWLNLLKTARRTDFLKVMKFCLNEDQIRQFKETTMNNYENIKNVIKPYFQDKDFHELKDLVDFCCPDQESRRISYRKIFKMDFFTIYDFSIPGYAEILKPKLKFIEDVYADDPDFSAHFNTDLLSSLMYDLMLRTEFISLNEVIYFFDAVAQFIQNLEEFKKERLLLTVKGLIVSGPIYRFSGEEVDKFVVWCLGEEDEIMKFKQSISPDQVLRNMLRKGKIRLDCDAHEIDVDSYNCMIEYPPTLDSFLSWYFSTPEEINEFKIRLKDVFKWIKPPVKNIFW